MRLLRILVALVLACTIGTAFAQSLAPDSVLPAVPSTVDIFNPANTTQTNSTNAVNLIEVGPARAMTIILSLFTLVGVIIAVYAGSQIIFSGGDAKKVEVAVKTLVYAGVGMLVVGMAWVIVRLVLNIDITKLW